MTSGIQPLLFFFFTLILFRPRTKKAKLDSGQLPIVQPSSSITSFTNILQLFEMAVRCFEVLNATDAMKFGKLHFLQYILIRHKNLGHKSLKLYSHLEIFSCIVRFLEPQLYGSDPVHH